MKTIKAHLLTIIRERLQTLTKNDIRTAMSHLQNIIVTSTP